MIISSYSRNITYEMIKYLFVLDYICILHLYHKMIFFRIFFLQENMYNSMIVAFFVISSWPRCHRIEGKMSLNASADDRSFPCMEATDSYSTIKTRNAPVLWVSSPVSLWQKKATVATLWMNSTNQITVSWRILTKESGPLCHHPPPPTSTTLDWMAWRWGRHCIWCGFIPVLCAA